jgi:hypothetical protein
VLHSPTTAPGTNFFVLLPVLPKGQRKKDLEDREDSVHWTDDFLDGEINIMKETSVDLDEAYKTAKMEKEEVKKSFNEEAKKLENSKATGQPLKAKMEEILKTVGIDFAEFHGKQMQGPACRKLLAKRDEIIPRFQELVLSLPQAEKREPDDEKTIQMLQLHRRLLGHVDALVAFLRSDRYSLDYSPESEEVAKAKHHRDLLSHLWRHAKISVTPKAHCSEAHAIENAIKVCGYGELGEDEGERAHQTGAKSETRYACVQNFELKANSINEFECMSMDPCVSGKQVELKEKRKRNFTNPARETADDRSEEAKRLRVEARDQLLGLPMMEGIPQTLRDRKHARTVAAAEPY